MTSMHHRRGERPFMARLRRLDARLTSNMREHGPTVLRWALAVVFLWFGALKLTGHTPVVELVAATIPWFSAEAVVLGLGVFEVLVGFGLLVGVWLRATLALFWLMLLGTFSVLVLLPQVAFQGGNPLLLTVEGEFVVKNLVLLAAGIVVGGTLHGRRLGSPRTRAGA